MKSIVLFFGLSSHLLLAQSHVAFLHHAVTSTFEDYTPAPYTYSISTFDLAGGMVIVKATVDGEPGDFILDTGAPGIVLNSSGDDGLISREAAGIGGSVVVKEVAIQNFEWGIIHRQRLNGYVVNISHLEEACGRNIKGLIGFEVFRNFELFLDYRNKTLKIYNAKEAEYFRSGKQLRVIPFSLYGNVPVVAAKVGGKKALLALDSGAEVNLLDKRFVKSFSEVQWSELGEEMVIGLGNQPETVLAATVLTTSIKSEEFPSMRFLFPDMSHLREQLDVPIDGLLGFPFFKNTAISINYQKRRIFLWK